MLYFSRQNTCCECRMQLRFMHLKHTYLQSCGLAVHDILIGANSRNKAIHLAEAVIVADFAILLKTIKHYIKSARVRLVPNRETSRHVYVLQCAYLPRGVQTLHASEKHIFIKRHVSHGLRLSLPTHAVTKIRPM